MEYKSLVKDFSDRTEQNLMLIEYISNKDSSRAFEVTQLINSLLGLIILPQQKFFDKIPNDSIEKAKTNGWLIPTPSSKYKQVKDLSTYLRYIRNGVSHFNIKFVSESETIVGIQIWNKPPRSDINWKINLNIEEIKSITRKFKELIAEYAKESGSDF